MNWQKILRSKPFIFVIVFMVTFGMGALIGKQLTHESFKTSISGGKPVNILLMGIDARSTEANSRSDTMILASVDGKNKKVALVWIPRDTRVEVKPDHFDKVNSVNYVYGPERACQVVGDLLQTKVNYYVVTNFYGFAKIIDILGGVDINVEQNMKHWDPDPKLSINLSKGQQHLNGDEALSYVRFRGVPTADIGRTGIQQNFVKALAKEMFQGKTILKLPQLIPEILKNVHTNIPVNDMAYMVKIAPEFDTEKIITQTLPGYSFTDPKSGASYWQADEKIADGIVEELLAGKTFDVAQARPSWVTTQPVVPAQTQTTEGQNAETQEDAVSGTGLVEELPDGGALVETGEEDPHPDSTTDNGTDSVEDEAGVEPPEGTQPGNQPSTQTETQSPLPGENIQPAPESPTQNVPSTGSEGYI